MFHVSFWCVDFPVSIPEIKWSCYPYVFPHYVCEGVWFTLNFHVIVTTLFVVTRALFRVLCSGVFVSMFGLCIKLAETVLQLVVLVATVIVGPGCVRLVRSAILAVGFFECLDSFAHFYWLYALVCCDWYDPSYWSLLLSLVLLFCKNP